MKAGLHATYLWEGVYVPAPMPTGTGNVVVGYLAGWKLTSTSDCVCIGPPLPGIHWMRTGGKTWRVEIVRAAELAPL